MWLPIFTANKAEPVASVGVLLLPNHNVEKVGTGTMYGVLNVYFSLSRATKKKGRQLFRHHRFKSWSRFFPLPPKIIQIESSLELESKQGVKRCPTLNSDTGTCLSHIQGHLFCSLCLCFSLDLVDLYIMIHFSHTQFSTPLRKFGGSEKIFYKNCYFSVYNLLYKQCNNHKVLSLNKKYKKTKLQLHTKHGF